MLRYFGTDGVRGEFGKVLTISMAYRIGRYLGTQKDGVAPRILLSRDTRISGLDLRNALVEGILKSGGIVYDEGVSTTPSISYLTIHSHMDYGVMISASHNPYFDNGIKIFNSRGEKLESEIEEKIEEYMDREEDDLPLGEGQVIDGASLREEYVNWLLSKANPKVSSLRVLVDCANGSASTIAKEFFSRLGVDATILFASPDGRNINRNCGSTHLAELQSHLKENHYDFAFAFDGDADRFLAFRGDGTMLDGDRIIYLNAKYKQERGSLARNKVVITVMSNLGLRRGLEKAGIGYETVQVGDKYVQACLKENGYVLGGEQSGHVIFLDELNTGDGFLSCVHLMNIAVEEPSLIDAIEECPIYPQVLENIRFSSKEEALEVLTDPSVQETISKVELRLGDRGRVLVRKSGTEPLIRVMSEASSEEECSEAVRLIVSAIAERNH